MASYQPHNEGAIAAIDLQRLLVTEVANVQDLPGAHRACSVWHGFLERNPVFGGRRLVIDEAARIVVHPGSQCALGRICGDYRQRRVVIHNLMTQGVLGTHL